MRAHCRWQEKNAPFGALEKRHTAAKESFAAVKFLYAGNPGFGRSDLFPGVTISEDSIKVTVQRVSNGAQLLFREVIPFQLVI